MSFIKKRLSTQHDRLTRVISLEGNDKVNGHAAIVKSVNGNEITILEQWKGSSTVRESTFTLTNSGSRKILGNARSK